MHCLDWKGNPIKALPGISDDRLREVMGQIPEAQVGGGTPIRQPIRTDDEMESAADDET
jgi:hypothetical protein